MPQPHQANLPEASINTSELLASAPATRGGLLPAQQDSSAESATPGSIGKGGNGAESSELRNSPDRNAEEGIEHLLKLIASLESSNMALLNKLNQAERELSMLRKPPAPTLPEKESTDDPEQLYGYSRKLTRMGWRPS